MNRYRALSAVTVTLSLALLTAGCSAIGLGDQQLASGDAVRAAADAPSAGTPAAEEGWTAELQLPDGRLTARVVPLDGREVAADDTFESRAAQVDDNATLVAVSWRLDDGAGVPDVARLLVLYAAGVEDEVALVSGDQRVPVDVDGLDHTNGFAYAAVADPQDLSLEVVFDGVTQSIGADDAAPHLDAAAEPLYNPGAGRASGFADCLDTVVPASLARDGYASCRAQAASWPWVFGDGWSSDGPWRLVRLETFLGPASGTGISGTRVEATLDGATPSSEQDQGGVGDELGTSTLLVFPDGDHLEVTRTSKVDGSPARLTGTLDLD